MIYSIKKTLFYNFKKIISEYVTAKYKQPGRQGWNFRVKKTDSKKITDRVIFQQSANKILLLQGPVGPFFTCLQKAFEDEGFEVKRILLNKADSLFSLGKSSYRFSGSIESWEFWLGVELKKNKPDAMVLFGSTRPAHMIATKIAHKLGIEVISLEEGYLRAGYITCEPEGNNQYSTLRNWKPGHIQTLIRAPLNIASSFSVMCFWGAVYYLYREITQSEVEKTLNHRATQGVIIESSKWFLHISRMCLARLFEKGSISQLYNLYSGGYILIPLQTPSDAQLSMASRGWSNEKLVKESLKALLDCGAKEILVFKTHPLDENAHKLREFIYKEAKACGLSHKVKAFRSGKLGKLAQKSSGMIVINSTSAFSALNYHVPVLVLGDAIFRHETIVTVGYEKQAIKEFLLKRLVKNSLIIKNFLFSVKEKALVPGDFYALKTQKITAKNVVSRVNSLINTRKFSLENTR